MFTNRTPWFSTFLTRYWVLLVLGAPLPLLLVLVWSGGATRAVNPAGTLSTLAFVGCLSCTPLNLLFGLPRLLKFKRPLGVAAFVYGTVHTLAFAFDTGSVGSSIAETLRTPSYLWGLGAVAVMLPLALTSNQAAMRLLKRNWKRLQQASYAVVGLLIAHLLLLPEVKPEYRVFAVILLVGLMVRLPVIRRMLPRQRSRSGLSS